MKENKLYKLTIIVAAYNVEQYIKDCISSFLVQKEDWAQLVIVNDGSTDNTAEIVSNMITGLSNVNLIQKKNGGLSSARNFGIDYCINNSEYISFLDGDDLLSNDYLKSFLGHYECNNSDIVEFNIQRFFEKDFTLPIVNICSTSKKTPMTSEQFSIVLKKYNWHACGRFFKANLFLNNRFTYNRRYEDFILVPNLYLESKYIDSINKNLYLYRFNPNSITRNAKSSDIDDVIFGFKELSNRLNNKQIKLLKQKVLKHFFSIVINMPPNNRKKAIITIARFMNTSPLVVKPIFSMYFFLFQIKQLLKKIK
ncbi:glycosyltransferase family 2 protein [Providencia stuartii]|uniref:glycosyltransferase family 2 protein n=1 Tax=Providencia stuartii TaxID=588 RepID=UPI001875451A|nr:glycosyltransferase family 2 protein [Providencia thailandensis]GHC00110.1 hypothetical protein GCM10007290_30340 [Providencia thailandensis]